MSKGSLVAILDQVCFSFLASFSISKAYKLKAQANGVLQSLLLER
jgi:hypothetical protein